MGTRFPFLLTRTLVILLLVLSTTACRGKKEAPDEVVPQIGAEEAARLVGDPAVLFVDNRPAPKFNDRHIPGALNLPYFEEGNKTNLMDASNLGEAAKGKKLIVFYCSGHRRAYHALLAARGWAIPAEMKWYKEGMEDWLQRGFPTRR